MKSKLAEVINKLKQFFTHTECVKITADSVVITKDEDGNNVMNLEAGAIYLRPGWLYAPVVTMEKKAIGDTSIAVARIEFKPKWYKRVV